MLPELRFVVALVFLLALVALSVAEHDCAEHRDVVFLLVCYGVMALPFVIADFLNDQ